MFYVGQKVVCIKRGLWMKNTNTCLAPGPHPVYGQIYTVSDIMLARDGTPVIRLVEIGSVRPFAASRFRPAVEKPCDISVFTKMLTPTEKERVT